MTCVTILSGALVGRARFGHYIILPFVIAGFIYPVGAHAAWDANGWLRRLGYLDFAGSGVV